MRIEDLRTISHYVPLGQPGSAKPTVSEREPAAAGIDVSGFDVSYPAPQKSVKKQTAQATRI